jgi:hypothetical protein
MQSAYVPNRQVHDNLRLIGITKDYCSNNSNNPVLVSLDAQKAFDSVSHTFIEKVLRKYNIPEVMIKTFKTLYNRVSSRVQINGFTTRMFNVRRSVKQGDALSCFLFNLCIDSLIRSIENDTKIPAIKILNLKIPKSIAYADDVAIITYKHGLQSVFDLYEHFSQVSGLYLNVDKTEILGLSHLTNTDPVNIRSSNGNYSIKFVDKVKICGITYSLDIDVELEHNVTDKISKMKAALRNWSKRGLSIFGRNLILKTFGLSQVIFTMQNTYYPDASLIEIKKICFNFLWNKKDDKVRAYERVARKILYLPKNQGGINAPNIEAINKALKVKQLLRSIDPNNKHFLREFQNEIIGKLFLINSSVTSNPFINDAIQSLNLLGKLAIDDLLAKKDDELLNKLYYDLICSIPVDSLFKVLKINDIAYKYSKTLRKELGIINLKHLINEFKFPSTDHHKGLTTFIINSYKPLFSCLMNRKSLDDDSLIFDNIPIGCNKFSSVIKISTKSLTERFNLKDKAHTNDVVVRPLFFGQHPKENEVMWLEYHNACLSNVSLFRMNLISSPLCQVCLIDQDQNHIFYNCANATLAWSILDEVPDISISNDECLNGSRDKIKNEIILLLKRTLFLNKNSPIDKKFIRYLIDNRISDSKLLLKKRTTNKCMLMNVKDFLAIGSI